MLQRLARVLEGGGRQVFLSSVKKSSSLSFAIARSCGFKKGETYCNMSSKSKPLPSALPIEVSSVIFSNNPNFFFHSRIGWSGWIVRWLVLRWRKTRYWRLLLWSLRWLLHVGKNMILLILTLNQKVFSWWWPGWHSWASGCHRVDHYLHPQRCSGQNELLVHTSCSAQCAPSITVLLYPRCVRQHGESGLTKACLESQISMKEAEDMVMKVTLFHIKCIFTSTFNWRWLSQWQ